MSGGAGVRPVGAVGGARVPGVEPRRTPETGMGAAPVAPAASPLSGGAAGGVQGGLVGGAIGGVVVGGSDPREEPLVRDIIELFQAKVVHVEKKPE